MRLAKVALLVLCALSERSAAQAGVIYRDSVHRYQIIFPAGSVVRDPHVPGISVAARFATGVMNVGWESVVTPTIIARLRMTDTLWRDSSDEAMATVLRHQFDGSSAPASLYKDLLSELPSVAPGLTNAKLVEARFDTINGRIARVDRIVGTFQSLSIESLTYRFFVKGQAFTINATLFEKNIEVGRAIVLQSVRTFAIAQKL